MDKSINSPPSRPIVRLKHWIRRGCLVCDLEYLYPPATRLICPRCGKTLKKIAEGRNERGVTLDGRT